MDRESWIYYTGLTMIAAGYFAWLGWLAYETYR